EWEESEADQDHCEESGRRVKQIRITVKQTGRRVKQIMITVKRAGGE
ncbi:hypothetical protein scyTo_0021418, partial [Scyliorhinus torazame]|nr:hypothetical protein [Scyliorhinus torazame]